MSTFSVIYLFIFYDFLCSNLAIKSHTHLAKKWPINTYFTLLDSLLHQSQMDNNSVSEDPKTPLLPLQGSIIAQRSESFHSSLKSIVTPKNAFVLLGPLLCTVICLCVKLDGPSTSRNMLAVLAWIFAWWLTEAVPMPITSMSPLFLFPLFGIASADDVAHSYMDDVIALVLGSFMLALAVEHYNIHRRLALNVSLFIFLIGFTFLIYFFFDSYGFFLFFF